MNTPTIKKPDSLSRIIMLTFGTMDHGGPYWCYVAVKPSRYQAFREAMASMRYHIKQFEQDNYGEIVVSGEGDRPPSDISKQVAQMFGVSVGQLFADSQPDETIRKQFELLASDANP
jgi:hypothetical protein